MPTWDDLDAALAATGTPDEQARYQEQQAAKADLARRSANLANFQVISRRRSATGQMRMPAAQVAALLPEDPGRQVQLRMQDAETAGADASFPSQVANVVDAGVRKGSAGVSRIIGDLTGTVPADPTDNIQVNSDLVSAAAGRAGLPAQLTGGALQFAPAMLSAPVGIPALAAVSGLGKYGDVRQRGGSETAAAASGLGSAAAVGTMALPMVSPVAQVLEKPIHDAFMAGNISAGVALKMTAGALDALPQAVAMSGTESAVDALASHDPGNTAEGANALQAGADTKMDPRNLATQAGELAIPSMLIGGLHGLKTGVDARTVARNAQDARVLAQANALIEYNRNQQVLRMGDEGGAASLAAQEANQRQTDELINAESAEPSPQQLATERTRVQSIGGQEARNRQILADLEASRAAGAREGAARAELAPDILEQRRIQEQQKANDAALARQQQAMAIDKQVADELALREQAQREQEQRLQAEHDANTEASAQAREAELEAKAKEQVQLGEQSDASDVSAHLRREELNNLLIDHESRGTIKQQLADARRERMREAMGSDYIDWENGTETTDGVERPLDIGKLKSRDVRDYVARTSASDRDRIVWEAARRMQAISAARDTIKQDAANAVAARKALREQKAADKATDAELRRAVPEAPPVNVGEVVTRAKERERRPLPPQVEPRKTFDYRQSVKDIMQAQRDGRLTREEAIAAVARAKSLRDEITPPKESSNALPTEVSRPPNEQATGGSSTPADGGGKSRAGSVGDANLPQLRSPGTGDGLSAGGRKSDGSASPSNGPRPVGDGSTGSPTVDPIQQQIHEERLRQEKAKLATAEHRGEGRSIEADRAAAVAEFQAAKARTQVEIDKAKVAEATDEARRQAAQSVKDLVDEQARRVDLAQARLDALTRAKGEKSRVAEAQLELETAKADHQEAKTLEAQAANTVKTAKADLAKNAAATYTKARQDHLERMRPHVEAGARDSGYGKDVVAVVTPEGFDIRDASGKTLASIKIDMEAKDPASVSPQAWWESMGGADGLRKRLGEPGAGARANKLLGGRKPASLEELTDAVSPTELRKLFEIFPVGGGYDLKTGDIKFYEAASIANLNAVRLAAHELNHKGVHGVLGAVLTNPELAPHIDVLARHLGIDPRAKPENVIPFLEAVQKGYAQWHQIEASRKAAVGVAKASGPVGRAIDKAFAAIEKVLAGLAKMLRLTGGGNLSLTDVYKQIEDGSLFAKAGETEPAKGEAYATDRRAVEDGEEGSNLSLGNFDPRDRGVVRQIQDKFAKPVERVSIADIQKAADETIAKVGPKKAADEILGDMERVRDMRKGEGRDHDPLAVVPELAEKSMILRSEVSRLMQEHADGNGLQIERLNRLVLADTEIGQDAAITLAARQDLWQTPEQRANSVFMAAMAPSHQMRQAIKKMRAVIRRAEAAKDPVAQRKAAQRYDDMVQRWTEANARAAKKLKEFGIDLYDFPSLTKMMDGEAYATVAGNIDSAVKIARGDATVYDWIVSNYRGHLLGDPLVTQTQQIVSNMVMAAQGVGRVAVTSPGALLGLMRSNVMGAVGSNIAASFQRGKNAWVDDVVKEELGRTDEGGTPELTDRYSRINNFFSFKLMAAIDGGAQRFNAQLEATSMLYRQAREHGSSVTQAARIAADGTRNGMSSEIAAEALYRSLPGTFQELAIHHPGERTSDKQAMLSQVSGTVSRVGAIVDEAIGRSLATLHVNFVDPITKEGVPVPVSKVVLPFVKTGLAIARAAARLSPVGVVEAGVTWAHYRNMKAAGETGLALDWAKQQAIRRTFESVVVGTVLMHAAAAMLQATGTQVDDKEASQTGRARGEKTFMLLGTEVPYSRVEPFATPLAMAANGIKAINEGRNPATAELVALLKMGSDLAWFRTIAGLGNVAENIRKSDTGALDAIGKSVSEGVAKTGVALTPIVGHQGLRNMLKKSDTVQYPSEDGFVGAVRGELGIADTQPRRDVWGRTVQRGPFVDSGTAGNAAERVIEGGLGKTPAMRPTDVDAWLNERGVTVGAWKVRVKGRTVDPETVDKFISMAGPLLLEELRQLKHDEPEISAEDLKSELRSIRSGINADVREKLGLSPEE